MGHLKRSDICAAICANLWLGLAPISAQANDNLVVYIECKTGDGQTSQGSGVLVSDKGHVLTARHVVPDGSSCVASIGNNSFQKRGIRKSFASRKISSDFDTVLMEFGRGSDEVFEHAFVCPVTDKLKESEIIAKGFHAESFGAPSSTNGILSNTAINFSGMVETSAMTINGKSGGPVFLKGTDQIVGIVAGAKFNALGAVSYYGMLASDAVLGSLDMLKMGACGGSAPEAHTPVAATAVVTTEEDPEFKGQTTATGPAEGMVADPLGARAAFNQGVERFDLGSYTLALEAFQKAAELDPSNPETFFNLGETHWYLDEYQQAIASYTAAIELNVRYVDAYFARGQTYFDTKRYQQAIEDFDKALALDPQDHWSYLKRGEVHHFLGQYRRAYDNYAEALRLEPGSWEAVSMMERLCATGEFDCPANWETLLPN